MRDCRRQGQTTIECRFLFLLYPDLLRSARRSDGDFRNRFSLASRRDDTLRTVITIRSERHDDIEDCTVKVEYKFQLFPCSFFFPFFVTYNRVNLVSLTPFHPYNHFFAVTILKIPFCAKGLSPKYNEVNPKISFSSCPEPNIVTAARSNKRLEGQGNTTEEC